MAPKWNEWLYEQCPCGSGRRLKFCCWPEVKELLDSESTHDDLVLEVRWIKTPAGLKNCPPPGRELEFVRMKKEGDQKQKEGKFAAAAKVFHQMRMEAEGLYSAWNNEAQALWGAGRWEEAVRLLERCVEWSGEVNAFGWAELAEMRYFLGNQAGAEEAAGRAAGLPPPTPEAAAKTSIALSLLGKEREVLEYVRGCGFEESGVALFHAGVAAANLGLREEALMLLEKADRCGAMGAPITRIAEGLARGETAEGQPTGRWLHFAMNTYEAGVKRIVQAFDEHTPGHETVLCDVVEILVSNGRMPPDDALGALERMRGARADALSAALRARGAEIPDELREADAMRLSEPIVRGILNKPGLQFHNSTLRMDVPMEGVWTDAEKEAYEHAIRQMKTSVPGEPGWKQVKDTLLRLSEGRPERYRVRFNYASALSREGRDGEALAIIREIFEAHPDYGHAAGTLMRSALMMGDLEGAEEISRRYRPPEVVDPREYRDMLTAQLDLLELRGDKQSAKSCRDTLRKIEKQFELQPLPRLMGGGWRSRRGRGGGAGNR